MILIFRKHVAVIIAAVLLCVAIQLLVFPVSGDAVRLPIIMYHHISEKSEWLNAYTVTPQEFESDLRYLQENGYTAVSAKELLAFYKQGSPLPPKPVMLTFDDGFESFRYYAMPLLQKYKMQAILAIVGASVDKYSSVDDHNIDYAYLTWEGVDEIGRCGYVEIANHTYDLHRLDCGRQGCAAKCGEGFDVYEEHMRADILRMQECIEAHVGKGPRIFAYPFGCLCDEASQVLQNFDFDMAFTCTEKVNILNDSVDLRRLCRFNRPHGISSEAFFKKMKE